MSRCFIWFPISSLGKPNLYQNLVDLTRKWVFYNIVVIFDFVVFLVGVCFRECYCFVPDESYLTKKMSYPPAEVFPSNPPLV